MCRSDLLTPRERSPTEGVEGVFGFGDMFLGNWEDSEWNGVFFDCFEVGRCGNGGRLVYSLSIIRREEKGC